MKVLIVNQSEVRNLLPMKDCIEVMAEALKALARGEAVLPLRQVSWLPDKRGLIAVMPSYLDNIHAMGAKIISVFPGNQGTQYDAHQGAVLLFETQNGRLLAIMDASEITAIRTAAVSGVATKLLARKDASDLAILGSGVQASTHLEAMLTVRKLSRVRVWSRTADHAKKFAKQESRRHNIKVEPTASAEKAVVGADIICTTTSASKPVLHGEWISPGAHINAAGSYGAPNRELDTAAVVHARLYVDRCESTLNEAGDFLIPKKEGAIGDDHILGELGEVLLGKIKGRTSRSQVTLFKSMGIAIEDLASAHYIYGKALEKGVGTEIELGGARHGTD